MKNLLAQLFILTLLMSGSVNAESLVLPLRLDYTLIKKYVVSQLFTGKEQSARLWHDKQDCSYLTLANPRISGHNGQIKLLNNVTAQLGAQFGGQCVTLVQWAGVLETLQQPTLSSDHSLLSLPVTQAIAYDRQGRLLNIAKLQDLIKSAAEPRLADLKIDLNKSRSDIERNLSHYVPQSSADDLKAIVSSLRFNDIKAEDDGIAIKLGFDTPTGSKPLPATMPLTETEQQQWQLMWQNWHGFLAKTIEQASRDNPSDELRDTLTEILLDSDRAFKAGLTSQSSGQDDPIRTFFTQTWERLSPVLRSLAKQLPEAKAMQYLTFISATDVIYQLDAIGSPFGLGISADGLRNLVRLLIAEQQQKKETLS